MPQRRSRARGHRAPPIRDLPFQPASAPDRGLEIFRLSDLYARADRDQLGHALDAPQRPAFHTIYVGIRGAGRIVIDFTPVPLGAGHLTIIARGRVQQFVPDRSVDAWMILFAPEFLALDPRTIDPLGAPTVLSATWPEPTLPLDPELQALTAQLVAEHARPADPYQPAILASLLRALLLRAEREVAAHFQPTPAPIARFLAALERDHAGHREVAHYARIAGVSVRTLGDLVAQHRGRSAKRVIDERVALEVRRQLAHSDLSIKELASRTGFSEPTNLVKFFRRLTGETPQAFRARHRTV